METLHSTTKRWMLLLVLMLMVFSSAPAVSAQGGGVNPFGQPSGQALFLDETFDGTTTPAGWSVVNNVGSVGWRFDNPGWRANNTGGSGNLAIADSDQAGYVTMDTELRTPAMNLSGHSVVKLHFKTDFTAYDNSTADVDVSADGGLTWTTVWRKTGADFQGATTVDLSAQAANQANVMVRFHYYNAYWAWWWQVDEVQVETPTVPAAPSSLNATATDYDVRLDWMDNSNNESGFKIERSLDGASGWVQIGSVVADTTTYTDKDLTCNTPYYYRVFAFNGAITSGYSNVANATTAACTATTSVAETFDATTTPAGWSVVNNVGSAGWRFDNPGGRANETSGSGNLAIADSDQAGYVTMDTELRTPVVNLAGQAAVQLTFKHYLRVYQTPIAEVDVSKDGGTVWTTVWRKTVDAQGPVVLDLSAQAGNQSNVMVRFRYRGTYDWYWEIDDVELTALAAPPAPTNLNATLAANNDVNLSWTWTGDGAPGFKIERSDGGGWTQIADVANGATTYIDSSVGSNTAYSYRVYAYNGAGDSGYSNTANVTTGDRSVTPIDVTISLYWSPIGAGRTPYENIIRYFADGVYEMTNGANKLRQVKIYTGGAYANQADIIWKSSQHPCANVSGRSYGGHVYMGDSGAGANFVADDCGWQAGGYGLAHEWGHYYYGVYDEYRNSQQACGGWIGAPCVNDTPVSYAIMNYQWGAVSQNCGQEGSFKWLNFSTALNDTKNTAQYRVFGASCWETVARPVNQDPRDGVRSREPVRLYHPELAAAAPATGQWPPVELPTGRNVARSELQIVWVDGSGGVASQGVRALAAASSVVRQIVIDSSENMTTTGQLEDVKDAVNALIEQAEVGDTLGIIHFDGTVTVTHVLTDVTGQATKDALRAAVGGITIGGSDAAPGDALQTALDGLTAAGVPTNTNRAVYLITAGRHTTGPYPLSVVPNYQVNFVTLYTFGYGAEEGAEATLRQMAEQTGGEYSSVDDSNALLDALTYADQDTSPVVDVNVQTDWGWVYSGSPVQIPIVVDSTLGELEVEVAYLGAPLSATLTLYDPNYSPTVLTDCESWGEGMDQLTVCFLSVSEPPAGTWTFDIVATDEDIFLVYWVGGSAQDTTLTFDAVVDSLTGDVIEYPEPIVVGASVGKEYPITGAVVTATLQAPDGTIWFFPMRDDGVAPDDVAGDGLYAALLDYAMDGDHTITVWFNNDAGTAEFTAKGLMNAPDLPYTPVGENFERFDQVQVSVTGWQWDDHSNWYDYAEWPPSILQTDNTAIASRIDYLYDIDVFEVTVPPDYTETLGLRIDNLGLDMDPHLYIFAADWSWGFDAYFEFIPTSDDFLFVPLSVSPGETFYVGVWHYDYGTATNGVYDISVGPFLSSDPTGQAKAGHRIYLPITLKNHAE